MPKQLSSDAMDAFNAACEEDRAAAADVVLAITETSSVSLQYLRNISRSASRTAGVALELGR
jgi:hypothetical protein